MLYQRITLCTGAQMDLYVPDPVLTSRNDYDHPALVVFPGGAYGRLSPREGEAIALRFMALGFRAFVLHYRVAPHRYPAAQHDAAAAVAYVRANAQQWRIHPDRIAVMGFSAGGHLAADLGSRWHMQELWQELGLTPADVRPNAMALCYSVITAGEYAHRESFVNLTGTQDEQAHLPFGAEKWVNPQTAPAFIWHTFTDPAVPVQNSLIMAQALAQNGVPAEVHLYPFGNHGAALCDAYAADKPGRHLPEAAAWPEAAARFLNAVMA